MWSMNKPFDENAYARLNVLIDGTYEAFLERVALGRNLSPEQARQIAKGRAYTGAQALQLKLVDELGGLDSALDYAAQQLGAKNRHDIAVQKFPKELNGVEKLLQILGQEVSLSLFIWQ
jgi:protease-4